MINEKSYEKKLTKLSLILFTLQFLFTGLFAQDEQKAELVVQTGHTSSINEIDFSPDGKILASGSSDNTIKLWDAASGQELKTLSGHTSEVYSVAFSPEGKRLVSGSIAGLFAKSIGEFTFTIEVE